MYGDDLYYYATAELFPYGIQVRWIFLFVINSNAIFGRLFPTLLIVL